MIERYIKRETERRNPFSAEIAHLLKDTFRPSPQAIASLIERGLSEDNILDVGESMGWERPYMENTLLELDNSLPYILALTDYLAENYGDKRLLFLERDSELLADIYAIRHPDKQMSLLPGSIQLGEWMYDTKSPLVHEFLAAHSLLLDDQPPSIMIDTGFRGTAGYWIWVALEPGSANDVPAIRALASRMPIKLMSAIGTPTMRWGEQIVDFNSDNVLQGETMFPKVETIIGSYSKGERYRYSRDPLAYRLAMSLQLMPHFHGTYEKLERTDKGIVAVPREEPVRRNIDEVTVQDEGEGRNASIVNPLAALVVQYRAIEASMHERLKKS